MAPPDTCIVLFIMLSAAFAAQDPTSTEVPDNSAARTALEYVEKIRNSPCSGGTEEVLPVQFDHSIWKHYAEVALRMSNLLTKIIIRNGNFLKNVTDEFLFDLVRNNVDGDSLIFGSAIAVEEWTYPKYRLFCPYAFKKDTVYAHDISLNYNYLDPNTEWYDVLRQMNWSSAFISENMVKYRYNDTSHAAQQILKQPLAQLDYGHWTLPYYDCGGGDIWMVTYSAPIFGMTGVRAMFKGIGTIDIELTNIDINQCDTDENSYSDSDRVDRSGSVDVFRGTHHCQPTTRCVSVAGAGFIPGAYKCVCADGYYFPKSHLAPEEKYYDGPILEATYFNDSIDAATLSEYQCTPCAEGCETCLDDSPCLYAYKLPVRVTLLALAFVIVILIILVSVVVALYREQRVIKSASPIFLHLVCVGAVLMVTPIFILFTEPNDISCVISFWPRHIGFCLAYGALLLKTWRITAIFRVKSAKKLKLSDRVLLQRLLPFIGVMLAYLSAWSGLGGKASVWRRTGSTDLKFTDCSTNWWSYGIVIGEAAFLLWGAYLCFVVRKAPSMFNESKYITWTIYNNIILGSFIIVAREFIGLDQGPDIIYVFDFVYIQVSVTSLICLIFLPKIWVVFRKDDQGSDTETATVTGLQQKSHGPVGLVSLEDTADKEIQVDLVKPQDILTNIVTDKSLNGTASPSQCSNKIHPLV